MKTYQDKDDSLASAIWQVFVASIMAITSFIMDATPSSKQKSPPSGGPVWPEGPSSGPGQSFRID